MFFQSHICFCLLTPYCLSVGIRWNAWSIIVWDIAMNNRILLGKILRAKLVPQVRIYGFRDRWCGSCRRSSRPPQRWKPLKGWQSGQPWWPSSATSGSSGWPPTPSWEIIVCEIQLIIDHWSVPQQRALWKTVHVYSVYSKMLPLCTCTLLVFVHTIITIMAIPSSRSLPPGWRPRAWSPGRGWRWRGVADQGRPQLCVG